jgi:hypothetical protein
MATATSIEIKRAAEQQRAADTLELILKRLDAIEKKLDALAPPAQPVAAQRGRTVHTS